MLHYCKTWLERPMGKIKDYVQAGHNSADWVDVFEKKMEIAPMDQTNAYTLESLQDLGFGSARSDAPKLQKEPYTEKNWFGLVGHLAPNNVIILIDTELGHAHSQCPIWCDR